jgi:hypothetical protein
MAVVNITKMWSKTGGVFDSALADPFDQSYSFTEGWQVLSDTIDDDPAVIANAPGLPSQGDQHRSNVNAFCTSIKATPLGPNFWMVEAGYEGQSPETVGVEVEWTDVTSSEPIDRDWNGRAIVTANGEQVEGLSMDVTDQVVVIRRRYQFINPAAIRQYRRSVNSDFFLGWPPGTARLVGWSARNQFKYGGPREAWDVTARIQFREPYAGTLPFQSWYKRWRHEGLMERVSVLNALGQVVKVKVKRATDSNNQEETKPVLLNQLGFRESNPDNAVFIHTKVYGSLPYSALGLL